MESLKTNKYIYSNQLQHHNNDICYNLQLQYSDIIPGYSEVRETF